MVSPFNATSQGNLQLGLGSTGTQGRAYFHLCLHLLVFPPKCGAPRAGEEEAQGAGQWTDLLGQWRPLAFPCVWEPPSPNPPDPQLLLGSALVGGNWVYLAVLPSQELNQGGFLCRNKAHVWVREGHPPDYLAGPASGSVRRF